MQNRLPTSFRRNRALDRAHRTEMENAITSEDAHEDHLDRTSAAVQFDDASPDLMLVHSSPSEGFTFADTPFAAMSTRAVA